MAAPGPAATITAIDFNFWRNFFNSDKFKDNKSQRERQKRQEDKRGNPQSKVLQTKSKTAKQKILQLWAIAQNPIIPVKFGKIPILADFSQPTGNDKLDVMVA